MRVQPWQKIGTANEHEVTSARELMVNAGLDWAVSLEDVYANPNGNLLPAEGKYATVRTNKDGTQSVIGMVGGRYQIFQNNEVFNSLDMLIDSGEARYAAAGELSGGKVVWAVLDLPVGVKIANDPHSAHLVVRTSHDGSTSFELAPIVTRLNCTNQINAAMASASNRNAYYSLKHTLNNKISAGSIRNILNVVYEDCQNYSDMANEMLSHSMSDFEFDSFIKRVYPLPAKVEFASDNELSPGEKRMRTAQWSNRVKATSVWLCETDTQHNIANTKFAAFQAVVEVADHLARGNKDKIASKILLSKDGTHKQRALQLLGV